MQQAIDFLKTKDETLKFILEHFGNPVIQIREQGFAAMVHIILEQQVSIASSKACYLKLENHYNAITPEKIIAASAEELRNCGVSRQKSSYLKDLASKVISGTLDFSTFSSKSELEIRSELLSVKGVGNWSIEVYLMFCLQSQDIIPLGDIAIRHTIKELYGITTLDEMEKLSNKWQPYRTIASYILWHYYLKKRKKI